MRTVEYPHGNLRVITLRLETMAGIKRKLAEVNRLESFHDVKQVYRWEDNFWTEQLECAEDIRSLKEHNMVLWTRSYAKIPPKGVNLKDTGKEKKAEQVEQTTAQQIQDTEEVMDNTEEEKEAIQMQAIQFLLTKCRDSKMGEKMLSEDDIVLLTDAVLNFDPYIISLFSNFKNEPETFIRYAKRKPAEYTKQKENEPKKDSDDTDGGDGEIRTLADVEKVLQQKNDKKKPIQETSQPTQTINVETIN